MKLAKKTLSVALAAIMAVSSAAVATSASAAVNFLPASDPAFKAVSVGTTTVTPDVKIETKYAVKKADYKVGDELKQIDETTLKNYYSFTPAKTGVYTMNVASAPVFYGVDKVAYDKLASNKGLTDAEKVEAATKYASSFEGLYTDATFATKLTAADCIDVITVENVKDKDPFVATTVTDSTVTENTLATLSYKYDATKKDVVVDKQVKTSTTGADVTIMPAYLVAGKTYYFQVSTVSGLLYTTEEVKDAKGDVYVNAVKSKAAPSAKITIAMASDEKVETTYTKEDQKVVVPYDFAEGKYDAKDGKYYVTRKVDVAANTVTYSGVATSYTVKDAIDGVKVVKFVNNSAALKSVTLGKNVAEVEGLGKVDTVVITNPDFVVAAQFSKDAKITAPANSIAAYTAAKAGYAVNAVCAKHDLKVVVAATVFTAGSAKCAICDATVATAKVAFAPTFKAKKGAVEVKGNAGKVAKVAVWVDGKKTVKKNVTKCTVKGLKAGKHVVKVKLYDANGNKTATVKKTVKVK